MIGSAFEKPSQRPHEKGRRLSLFAASGWLPVSLVLLATFFAYAGTLWFKFVYDDRGQILANVEVHAWRYLPHYFVERVWSFAYPTVPGNYYRPIFLLFLLINYKIFGPYASGWHLVTVAAHVAVTYLVYLMVRRLTCDPVTALIAAAIFGVDPVHIESVAWISGVTDPLFVVFLMPSFLCYLNWRERKPHRRGWLAGSLALYAFAMLSKETALVLPIIIFVYDWIWGDGPDSSPWFRRALGRLRGGLVATAPFVTLSVAYLGVRWQVLKGLGHVMTPLSISTIFLTWPGLLLFYFRHLVWPFNLSVFYDQPYVREPGLLSFFLPLAGLFALAFLGWHLVRWLGMNSPLDKRVAVFACAWIWVPFIPLLDLSVLPVGEIAHDRYLYLPSMGFSILLAMALRRIRFGRKRLFGAPALQAVFVPALVLMLVVATATEDRYWANDVTLYTRGVERTPYNKLARTNLGNALGEQGRYPEAIQLYRQVLEQDPHFWLAVYNMGYTFYRMGNLPEAERYFERAIAISGVDSDEYFYLGLTWMKMGRLNDAEAAVRHALEIQPGGLAYHFALGMILKLKGDIPGALAEFNKELKNSPGETGAEQQIEAIRMQLARTGTN